MRRTKKTLSLGPKKTGSTLNKLNKQNDKHCLVTLRDLKNVRLKRTKEDDGLEKIKLR